MINIIISTTKTEIVAMAKLSKKLKSWIVISVVWIILSSLFAGQNAKHTNFDSFRDELDVQQFITLSVILNIPLIIGWGVWRVRRS